MEAGIQRTCILLFLIALGFLLKTRGVLGREERQAISKIYTYITFPAVIISSLRSFSRELGMLWLIPLGLAVGLCMMLIVVAACRKKSREERAFAALNCSAFSIGAFTLPFLQGYLSPVQLLPVMLYDIGNGIFSFGGTAAGGRMILDGGSGKRRENPLKQLVQSVPVWTYLLMLLHGLLRIQLPQQVYAAAEFIGAANPVLCMLLIGCTLEFSKRPGLLRWIGRLLLVHYATVFALSVLIYQFLPAAEMIRSVIIVLLFSPLGLAGLVFTERFGLDHRAAGILNSLTIIISIAAISILIPFLGLGAA